MKTRPFLQMMQEGALFNRKFRFLLNKTLRGMRTRAKWKFVAKATALGARVPRAELFILWNFFKKLHKITEREDTRKQKKECAK